jgi:hypothetical protein
VGAVQLSIPTSSVIATVVTNQLPVAMFWAVPLGGCPFACHGHHSRIRNSQVGKGGLPPLTFVNIQTWRISGGKPPFPTCEFPYVE